MAENYLQKATQIYRGFNAESSREWLRKNGMTELAKMLLDDMADARSEEDYKKAEYQFKNRIVVPFFKAHVYPRGEKAVKAFVAENPIINVAPPKSVGSYDELKKNQAFVDSRYARKYTDEKGETRVNVPLLQIANDPEELSLAAFRLGITPEDLHDHIVNEWQRKKEKEWPEIEASMKKEMLANRGKVVKEYDKNFWSRVLRTVAPEIYAGMRRDIAEGKGEAGTVASFDVPVLGKFDIPSPAFFWEHKKDIALDAGRNVALAATGITANPFATAALVGGTELATLAGSDYYDLNTSNIVAAGTGAIAAGTVPGMVQRYAAPLLRSGNRIVRNVAKDILRKIRTGEGTPAEAEQRAIYEKIDDAASLLKDFLTNPNTRQSKGDYENAVKGIMNMANKSPKMAFSGGTELSFKDIEEKLLSNEGIKALKKFLTAPSKATYTEWNTYARNQNLDAEQTFYVNQAMERTGELFPETLKEIKYISGNGKKLNNVIETGAKGLNLVGSKTEPMITRNFYSEGLSSYEADHPEQVEAWKRYGIPEWDPLAAEFKEKYGQPETVMSR